MVSTTLLNKICLGARLRQILNRTTTILTRFVRNNQGVLTTGRICTFGLHVLTSSDQLILEINFSLLFTKQAILKSRLIIPSLVLP